MHPQNNRGQQHGNMMNGMNQGQMGGAQMMGATHGHHQHQHQHQHQHGVPSNGMNQGQMSQTMMGGNGINPFGKMPMPQPQMQMKPMGNMGGLVRPQNQQPAMMQGSMPNKMGGMMMQQPAGRMNNGIAQRNKMMPSPMGNMQQMQGNQIGGMGQNTMMTNAQGNNNMMMAPQPNQMPMMNQPIVMGQNHMSMAVPTTQSQMTQQGTSMTMGDKPMSFFNAVFPPNSPLGITVEDGYVSYSVNVANSLQMNRIEVCTIVSSQLQTQIQPGDVIVSVNSQPTISLIDSAGDVQKMPRSIALAIITQQSQVPRKLTLMRFRDPIGVLKNGTVLHFDNANDLAPLFALMGSNAKLNNNPNNSGQTTMPSNDNYSGETTSYAAYLAITFPPNQESLGLSLVPIRLTYKLEETGQNKTIDCCAVTSSNVSQYVRSGDILVKINGMALNSPSSGKATTNAMEQNMFLTSVANKLKSADRTNGRIVVVLRQVC